MAEIETLKSFLNYNFPSTPFNSRLTTKIDNDTIKNVYTSVKTLINDKNRSYEVLEHVKNYFNLFLTLNYKPVSLADKIGLVLATCVSVSKDQLFLHKGRNFNTDLTHFVLF
jgi:hypothetical protein